MYLRVSVVEENVPLLVSHKALTQMGAILDLPKNQIEMQAIHKTVPMILNSAGHMGFCLWDESMAGFTVGDQWASLLETEEEVYYLEPDHSRTRVVENTPVPHPDHRPSIGGNPVFHTLVDMFIGGIPYT